MKLTSPNLHRRCWNYNGSDFVTPYSNSITNCILCVISNHTRKSCHDYIPRRRQRLQIRIFVKKFVSICFFDSVMLSICFNYRYCCSSRMRSTLRIPVLKFCLVMWRNSISLQTMSSTREVSTGTSNSQPCSKFHL